MTGRLVPAEALERGLKVHLEPHVVRGCTVGHVLDVEVDGIRYEDDLHDHVVVDWHACPRFTGSRCGMTGCTTYDHDQAVLVIGEAA